MNRWLISKSVVLGVLAFGSVGCAVSADGGKVGSVEKLGKTQSELVTPSEYTWNQYQNSSTVMMSTNDGYCYLTGVSGRFAGGGEGVWVTVNNGFWVLTGQSGQYDVSARARCMPWGNVTHFSSASYTWDNWGYESLGGTCPNSIFACAGPLGPTPFRLWDKNSFCHLAGFKGVLNGSGEWIQVQYDGNPGWFEQSATGAQGNMDIGDGQCVFLNQNHPIWFTGESDWVQGQPAVDLGPISDRVCMLTLVRGHFQGAGEHVEITTIGGDWVLEGGSAQQGVEARARCLWLSQ